MHKGRVVLVPFPFTDLSGMKVRPALILFASKKGDDCICAFISSQTTKKKQPFTVPIFSSKSNGLKINSLVFVDKIATLEKKVILGEIGVIDNVTQKLIDTKLKELFSL